MGAVATSAQPLSRPAPQQERPPSPSWCPDGAQDTVQSGFGTELTLAVCPRMLSLMCLFPGCSAKALCRPSWGCWRC